MCHGVWQALWAAQEWGLLAWAGGGSCPMVNTGCHERLADSVRIEENCNSSVQLVWHVQVPQHTHFSMAVVKDALSCLMPLDLPSRLT